MATMGFKHRCGTPIGKPWYVLGAVEPWNLLLPWSWVYDTLQNNDKTRFFTILLAIIS